MPQFFFISHSGIVQYHTSMRNEHINTQDTQEPHLVKRPDIDSYSRERM